MALVNIDMKYLVEWLRFKKDESRIKIYPHFHWVKDHDVSQYDIEYAYACVDYLNTYLNAYGATIPDVFMNDWAYGWGDDGYWRNLCYYWGRKDDWESGLLQTRDFNDIQEDLGYYLLDQEISNGSRGIIRNNDSDKAHPKYQRVNVGICFAKPYAGKSGLATMASGITVWTSKFDKDFTKPEKMSLVLVHELNHIFGLNHDPFHLGNGPEADTVMGNVTPNPYRILRQHADKLIEKGFELSDRIEIIDL